MVQLLTAIAITVVVVLFAMSNSHHVEVNYIFGEPIRIRLIFLLTIAFVGGAVGAFFYRLVAGIVRRAEARRRRVVDEELA